MKITQLGNKIYEVESASSADITYVVNTGAEKPTCTCTAFAMKRNRTKGDTGIANGWCKHLDAVSYEFPIESREEEEQIKTEMAVSAIKLKHLLEELGDA